MRSIKIEKGGVVPLFIILIGIVLVGAFAVGYLRPADIVGTGSYLERPVFKYIKCEPVSSLSYSNPSPVSSGGSWAIKPSVSDSYNVRVNIDSTPFGGQSYLIYSVCNSQVNDPNNCRVSNQRQMVTQGNSISVNSIRPNEYVWIHMVKNSLLTAFQDTDTTGASYSVGFIPYGLREYNSLNGGLGTLNPNDCTISQSDSTLGSMLLGTDLRNTGAQPVNNQYATSLQPNEVRWYVAGYVTSAAPSFQLTYNGQLAWCQKQDSNSATIRKINTVSTSSGTYKVASVDLSDNLGTVVCCPGDKEPGRTCGANYQWISLAPIDSSGKTNVQCSTFSPCDGGTFTPYGKGIIARYACVSGQCVQQTQNVQCATDKDCSDSNQICDRTSWTCARANVNIDGQVINTIADNPQDCSKQGGKWVSESTTQSSGALCIAGFGICTPQTTVKAYCDTSSGFPWGSIAFWLVLIVVIVLLVYGRSYLYAVYHGIRSALHL